MFTVFKCRKCGHELYVEEVGDLGDKLGKVAELECPACGEEGWDNWVLSHRAHEFREGFED